MSYSVKRLSKRLLEQSGGSVEEGLRAFLQAETQKLVAFTYDAGSVVVVLDGDKPKPDPKK